MGAFAPVFALTLAVLIQVFGFVPGVQADVVDWSSFTRTVNETFSGNNPHNSNNIIVLLLASIAVIVITILFKLYRAREKSELLQYEINREKKLAQLAASTNEKQQRKWFRIKRTSLLKWIPSYKAIHAKESHYEKAQLLDISGGGLRFQTTSLLKVDDELTFFLNIGDKKPLSLKGKVLRIEEKGGSHEPVYEVAIQFGDLLTGERDRLVSWITKGQRDAIHEEKIAGLPQPGAEEMEKENPAE